MFWDDIRTVDYLLDPAGGGPQAASAASACRWAACAPATWPRWTTGSRRPSSSAGWPPSRRSSKSKIRNTIGHTKVVPGLYRHLDYPDVASLAMPAAAAGHQRQPGRACSTSTGVRACFDKLAACYAKAGIPERLRTRLYDTPHEFNAEMQAEAWAWLARHLAT